MEQITTRVEYDNEPIESLEKVIMERAAKILAQYIDPESRGYILSIPMLTVRLDDGHIYTIQANLMKDDYR